MNKILIRIAALMLTLHLIWICLFLFLALLRLLLPWILMAGLGYLAWRVVVRA